MRGEVVRRSHLHFRLNSRPRKTIPIFFDFFLSFSFFLSLFRFARLWGHWTLVDFASLAAPKSLISGHIHFRWIALEKKKKKREKKPEAGETSSYPSSFHTRCTSALPSSRLRLTQFIALRPAACLLAYSYRVIFTL